MNRSRILSLVLMVSLAGCGSLPQETPALSEQAAPISSDSSNISVLSANKKLFKVKVYGKGNKSLKDAIASLPEERRNAPLVVVEGDKIYSNDDELLRQLHQYVQIGEDEWIDETGAKVHMPKTEPKPEESSRMSAQALSPNCTSDGSGPFIRNISPVGYSKFHGDVMLPGSGNAIQSRKANGTPSNPTKKVTENIDLYSGGWGATGIAIDAGFQRNDSGLYQGFMKVSAKYAPTDSANGGYALGSSPQFVGAKLGTIDFYALNDNSVWATMYGTDSSGAYTSVTYKFASIAGYTETGTNVEVRFTTSVAQAINGATGQDLTSGAYVSNQWSGMQIGNANGMKNWTQSSGLTAKSCLYPSANATGSWINDTTYKTTISLPYAE